MKARMISVAASAIVLGIGLAGQALAAGGGEIIKADPSKHFDPKGNAPSKYTVEVQKERRKTLPFDDTRDFEEAKKGLIATPDYKQIKADDGRVVWDIGSWEWLLGGKDYDSIHPSLQRQAILNMASLRCYQEKSIRCAATTSLISVL